MPSNHLILCCPLLLLPSIFPSISVFSNESALPIRWSKFWSFSISPSNEYSGLISFRIDWFDLFPAQGTLRSLLQHHSSKASILQCSLYGPTLTSGGFPGGSAGKESTCNVRYLASTPELGRSPGGGHSNSLQQFCLENPHGQRGLAGCIPRGHEELDRTEGLGTARHRHTEINIVYTCLVN